MVTGSCLCRGVRFEVRGKIGPVAFCHCQDCRKAQGSAYAVNADVARTELVLLEGQDLVASYESTPGKHRTFCSRCGSPLYSRRDDDAGTVRIRLGLLDDDPGVKPSLHVWTADRAPWERLADDGLPRVAANTRESLLPRFKLRAEDPTSLEAVTLIAALDEELSRVYPPDAMFGLHHDDHDPARLVFLVGRLRDRAVACGALRSLDDETGEVKRMYVLPELRGEGLSRRMLAAIETIAVGRRHRRLRLETGRLSPAALALYRSSGFREIPLYGEYVGGAYSLCFEKSL